ncbi:MAG: flagellar filament capping protein FliD [Calditrichaeota bacterium]|nr:flagellar filament capping protein FliD [Calditrichota bacterium]
MISPIGGNNIELLLQSYRVLEERPIRELESRKEAIDNRIQLFNQLKTKLNTLQSLVKDLGYSGSTSIWGRKAATSSDESIVTVSATSSAVATSHTIFVSQLAKADQVVSNQYTATGTDISSTLGAGTFTFNVTVNGTTKQVSVDIQSGDDNQTVLENIVTAVNNTTDIGIQASIVKDSSSTVRLVFTSKETGQDYEMSLADVSGSLLSTIGMNDSVKMSGTSGGYVYDSTELNAIVLIDGITVTSNSNTIEDAIEGLTITLHKRQESTEAPVTINVTNDVEAIKGKIEDFINAYNEVMDFIQSNTAVNTTTYERSTFSGDFSVMQLRLQLRQEIAEPVDGLPSGYPTILSEIGISTDRDGKLSISDSDKLEDMIRNNLEQVEALFNSSDGYSGRLDSILEEMTSGEGVIESRKDVLSSQINRINNRIELLQKQIDRKMEYYRDQFSRLQAAYAMYTAQFNYVSSVVQAGFFIPG